MIQEKLSLWSHLYELVSGLYLREPTEKSVSTLGELAPDIGSLLEDNDISHLLAQAGDVAVSELRQEYYDLFLVPVSGRYLPPFESAHRANRLWGPSTHAVQALYQATGFHPESLDTSDCWNGVTIPDHIGFELAFDSSLLRSLAGAEDTSEMEALVDTVTFFVDQTLAKWAEPFGQKVQQNAETPFYRAVGLITTRIVPVWRRAFGETLQKVSLHRKSQST